MARYLANRPRQKLIFRPFFINITYLLIRPFYGPLKRVIKPKKKIFINSEKDIIRFTDNLTFDNVLEKKEALLVQSALKFDDEYIHTIITPWEKVVTLKYGMSSQETQNVHEREFFTRYPVLNKKEVTGIFNIKVYY